MKYIFIRILLVLVAEYELELTQLDVKTTFLHGDLEEEIYMTRSCGFKVAGKKNYVRKIIKGGDVLLKKINTKDNPSNMLTKVISGVKFQHYLKLIQIIRMC